MESVLNAAPQSDLFDSSMPLAHSVMAEVHRYSNARVAYAERLGITPQELHKLCTTVNATELCACIELLKARKHRSPFRQSVDKQLRAWLAADNEGSGKPLSPRQLEAIMPRWPVHNQIPD